MERLVRFCLLLSNWCSSYLLQYRPFISCPSLPKSGWKHAFTYIKTYRQAHLLMGLTCTQGAHYTWRKPPTVKPEHSERGVESKPTIHESIVVADALVTVTHCINGFELFDLLIHFSQCLKETFLHVLSVVLTPYCTGNFFLKSIICAAKHLIAFLFSK